MAVMVVLVLFLRRVPARRRPMVQYYCAGVSGIRQAQEVYRLTMSGVNMVSDPFGSYDTLECKN